MALTIEDGTGITDADSYVSVADARGYIASRYGPDDPFMDLATARVECLLRLAADWLAVFASKWLGERKSLVQGLDFPRTLADDPFPQRVLQQAQTEVARRLGDEKSLLPDGDPSTTSSASFERKSVKAGPVEIEYAVPGNGSRSLSSAQPYRIPVVEVMLRRYAREDLWPISGFGPSGITVGRW